MWDFTSNVIKLIWFVNCGYRPNLAYVLIASQQDGLTSGVFKSQSVCYRLYFLYIRSRVIRTDGFVVWAIYPRLQSPCGVWVTLDGGR